ncbi:GNAT family N-acetyltransferase [Clostridium sp. P21]|uniref:GNAT family N-acetyltransferase n=1 Tax=Clostridium muellerianum TaxID=2716538 RepID=A0A7Y0EK12_9CLOT|nr:GNAT family N-acetyltransferase [Clostridium muellerianum]NMM64527.1 GNAT family N-acetyltransferase [Clostridium muellerianum]
MLDIEVKFHDIEISNINKEDLEQVQKWMELQKSFLREETDADDLKERFLESYISECEFFLKINKNSKLIGILKGRLEFKNPSEAWIWFFYLDDNYRNTELTNATARNIMKYFYSEYGVNIFLTRIIKDDIESINFWKGLEFKSIRIVKNFYKIHDEYKDMIIMKKVGI